METSAIALQSILLSCGIFFIISGQNPILKRASIVYFIIAGLVAGVGYFKGTVIMNLLLMQLMVVSTGVAILGAAFMIISIMSWVIEGGDNA